MAKSEFIIRRVSGEGDEVLESLSLEESEALALRALLISFKNRPKLSNNITWQTIKEIEALKVSAICLVLKDVNWNKTEAAIRLGIKRTTLTEMLQRWGINDKSPENLRASRKYIDAIYGTINTELVKQDCISLLQEVINEHLSNQRSMAIIDKNNGKASDTITRENCL